MKILESDEFVNDVDIMFSVAKGVSSILYLDLINLKVFIRFLFVESGSDLVH